jgi:hypothetical protein
MMRNGIAYRLPPLVRLTDATESGLWPCVTSSSGGANHASPAVLQRGHGLNLAGAVKMWPTPTSTLGSNGGMVTPRKGREGGTLIEAVSARMWPTPTADRHSGLQSHGQNAILGSLNPTWVEWLMGYPAGWTDLQA